VLNALGANTEGIRQELHLAAALAAMAASCAFAQAPSDKVLRIIAAGSPAAPSTSCRACWPTACRRRELNQPVVVEAKSGAGLSPLVADLLVGLDQMFRESVIAETTSTVEDVTGRAPRSLTEWLTDNLDVFRAEPA
jgi:hypothetical protein